MGFDKTGYCHHNFEVISKIQSLELIAHELAGREFNLTSTLEVGLCLPNAFSSSLWLGFRSAVSRLKSRTATPGKKQKVKQVARRCTHTHTPFFKIYYLYM